MLPSFSTLITYWAVVTTWFGAKKTYTLDKQQKVWLKVGFIASAAAIIGICLGVAVGTVGVGAGLAICALIFLLNVGHYIFYRKISNDIEKAEDLKSELAKNVKTNSSKYWMWLQKNDFYDIVTPIKEKGFFHGVGVSLKSLLNSKYTEYERTALIMKYQQWHDEVVENGSGSLEREHVKFLKKLVDIVPYLSDKNAHLSKEDATDRNIVHYLSMDPDPSRRFDTEKNIEFIPNVPKTKEDVSIKTNRLFDQNIAFLDIVLRRYKTIIAISKKIKVIDGSLPEFMNKKDTTGKTALIYAVLSAVQGHASILLKRDEKRIPDYRLVKKLLEYEANPCEKCKWFEDRKNSKAGKDEPVAIEESPLTYALKKNNRELLGLFLAHARGKDKKAMSVKQKVKRFFLFWKKNRVVVELQKYFLSQEMILHAMQATLDCDGSSLFTKEEKMAQLNNLVDILTYAGAKHAAYVVHKRGSLDDSGVLVSPGYLDLLESVISKVPDRWDLIEALLSENIGDLNSRDQVELLEYAIDNGKSEIAVKLIDFVKKQQKRNEADPLPKTKVQDLFYKSLCLNSVSLLKSLKELGAEVNQPMPMKYLNIWEEQGYLFGPIFRMKIREEHQEIESYDNDNDLSTELPIEWFLKHVAPNLGSSESLAASSTGADTVIRLLLPQEDASYWVKNKSKNTGPTNQTYQNLLHLAMAAGNYEAIQSLVLELDFTTIMMLLREPDYKGRTPFHCAAEKGFFKPVSQLMTLLFKKIPSIEERLVEAKKFEIDLKGYVETLDDNTTPQETFQKTYEEVQSIQKIIRQLEKESKPNEHLQLKIVALKNKLLVASVDEKNSLQEQLERAGRDLNLAYANDNLLAAQKVKKIKGQIISELMFDTHCDGKNVFHTLLENSVKKSNAMAIDYMSKQIVGTYYTFALELKKQRKRFLKIIENREQQYLGEGGDGVYLYGKEEGELPILKKPDLDIQREVFRHFIKNNNAFKLVFGQMSFHGFLDGIVHADYPEEFNLSKKLSEPDLFGHNALYHLAMAQNISIEEGSTKYRQNTLWDFLEPYVTCNPYEKEKICLSSSGKQSVSEKSMQEYMQYRREKTADFFDKDKKWAFYADWSYGWAKKREQIEQNPENRLTPRQVVENCHTSSSIKSTIMTAIRVAVFNGIGEAIAMAGSKDDREKVYQFYLGTSGGKFRRFIDDYEKSQKWIKKIASAFSDFTKDLNDRDVMLSGVVVHEDEKELFKMVQNARQKLNKKFDNLVKKQIGSGADLQKERDQFLQTSSLFILAQYAISKRNSILLDFLFLKLEDLRCSGLTLIEKKDILEKAVGNDGLSIKNILEMGFRSEMIRPGWVFRLSLCLSTIDCIAQPKWVCGRELSELLSSHGISIEAPTEILRSIQMKGEEGEPRVKFYTNLFFQSRDDSIDKKMQNKLRELYTRGVMAAPGNKRRKKRLLTEHGDILGPRTGENRNIILPLSTNIDKLMIEMDAIVKDSLKKKEASETQKFTTIHYLLLAWINLGIGSAPIGEDEPSRIMSDMLICIQQWKDEKNPRHFDYVVAIKTSDILNVLERTIGFCQRSDLDALKRVVPFLERAKMVIDNKDDLQFIKKQYEMDNFDVRTAKKLGGSFEEQLRLWFDLIDKFKSSLSWDYLDRVLAHQVIFYRTTFFRYYVEDILKNTAITDQYFDILKNLRGNVPVQKIQDNVDFILEDFVGFMESKAAEADTKIQKLDHEIKQYNPKNEEANVALAKKERDSEEKNSLIFKALREKAQEILKIPAAVEAKAAPVSAVAPALIFTSPQQPTAVQPGGVSSRLGRIAAGVKSVFMPKSKPQ